MVCVLQPVREGLAAKKDYFLANIKLFSQNGARSTLVRFDAAMMNLSLLHFGMVMLMQSLL